MPNAMPMPKQKIRRERVNVVVRILNLIGCFAVVGSIVSWFASVHWIGDMLAHLRVQYVILLLPALAIVVIRRKRLLTAIVLGFIAYNVWPTIPYFVPVRQSSASRTLENEQYRVLSFNVLRTNREFAKTLEEIMDQDADFVFLMEVQNAWQNVLAGVKDRYPSQKVLADPAYTGVAFLSKIPWDSLEVVMLGDVSNPSIDVRLPCRGPSSRTIRIIATHPLPPFGDMLTTSRDRQLKTLAERFVPDDPNLLVGDLNLSPWSPRFAKFLKKGNLVDASLGYGIATTLDPLPTWLGGVKVDHVLTDRSLKIQNYFVKQAAYSDDKMVIVDFSVDH